MCSETLPEEIISLEVDVNTGEICADLAGVLEREGKSKGGIVDRLASGTLLIPSATELPA